MRKKIIVSGLLTLLVGLALVVTQASAASNRGSYLAEPSIFQGKSTLAPGQAKEKPGNADKAKKEKPSRPEKEQSGKPDKTHPNKPEKAQGNKPEKETGAGKQKFNFKGEVVSFDGSSLVIALKDGGEATVAVDANTVFKSQGASAVPQPGDQVIVHAERTADGGYLALAVHLVPGKPVKLHRVGEVVAYTPGASITVQNKKGESTTFTITETTVLLPADRADQLKVGSWVTVISPRDPSSSGTPVAMKIVIHPTKE